MTVSHHRRRVVIGALKLIFAGSILAYLFYRLSADGVFSRLVDEPKNWRFLALAQVCVIGGITLNFVRWFLLVRALELDFRLSDALRLGSLGHLLNQVSPGSVGGDLFKAVFIAREQPEKRTEAIASVVIDRVVGLYAMLLVACLGYAIAGGAGNESSVSTEMRSLITLVVALTAIGTAGIGLLMTPAVTGPQMRIRLERIPGVGHTLGRLLVAAGAYRSRRRDLFAAIGVACCTHTLFVIAAWCVSQGLPVKSPSFSAMFLVGPMSLAAGALPLTPSGLGTFELAMDKLFVAVGGNEGDGALVAITYRVMTYVMAGLGAAYYLTSRTKVQRILHEAEDLADELA